MGIPSTGLGGADYFSSVAGFGLIMQLLSYAFLPFSLLLIGLTLYYYTGDKKKADEFMPTFMAFGFRIFTYVWLLIISVTGFLASIMIMNPILDEILPNSKFGFGSTESDFDDQTLVQGLFLLLLMLGFAVAKIMMNRYAAQVTGMGGTVSTKLFVYFGMTIFSILVFISSISVVMSIISYAYEPDEGIDHSLFSMFIASMIFFGIYASKGMKILKTSEKR